MPRPYMKIIAISLLVVGSNYYSYDLGYSDGVRDIIKEIIELREELKERQQSIDPAVNKVFI